MPPKPKFTKEEIIAAALELVAERGIDALTARELGGRLGSSARPIFTVFKNMEELTDAVRAAAMHRFEQYAQRTIQDAPVFKQIGMQMVLFAVEKPKLFQFLFMTENQNATSFDDIFEELGTTADLCIEVIQKDYALEERDARILFQQLWLYTFGIGALCASKMCRFSEEQLMQMLSTEFMAMMMLIRSGKLHTSETV